MRTAVPMRPFGCERSSCQADADGVSRASVAAHLRRDDAVTGIEMAILFPAVLLVVLSMFQISLYWHAANSVGVAAEQGVSAGRTYPDDRVRAVAEAEAEADWILTSTNHGNGESVASINGDLITVTVTADAPRIVGVGRWQVRSVAEARFEEFVPVNER